MFKLRDKIFCEEYEVGKSKDVLIMSLERILAEHEGSVWAVMVTEDGTRATSGSGDRTVRVWDLTTGECLHILKHENQVTSVADHAGWNAALTSSMDQIVQVGSNNRKVHKG